MLTFFTAIQRSYIITKDSANNGRQKCETPFASMYGPDIITKEPGCADVFLLQFSAVICSR